MMTQTASPAPAPPVMAAPAPVPVETEVPESHNGPPHTQKIKHRSSKPILAWVQRKFAGGNNPSKHPKDQASPTGLDGTASSQERQRSGTLSASTNSRPSRAATGERRLSEPKKDRPNYNVNSVGKQRKSADRGATSVAASSNKNASMRKKAMLNHAPPSLVSTAGNTETGQQVLVSSGHTHGSDSAPPSPRSTSLSFAAWSNPGEADDDASIRPLPPTSPPSPAPSKSTHHTISSYTSGGYVSDPKTFRSGAASTKPTTLLSIDVGHTVAAHIAQAPSTTGGAPSIVGGTGTAPSSPSLARFPSGGPRGHAQGPSTGSITFSTLPTGARHPLAAAQVPEPEEDDRGSLIDDTVPITVPNLSHYHPRNNPRPLSPPLDNASMLTLASSTMANGGPRPQGTPSIASRFPVSVSGLGFGGYEEGPDASVRALRPRSRRGSWGSVTSTETGWSAAVHALGPSARKYVEESVRSTADGPDEEDRSIRHAPIDEEDDLVASVTSNATANAAPAVPITLTVPTPDASKSATPQKEVEDPTAIQVVRATATASETIKAEAEGEKQVEVASADVLSVGVPVAKATTEE